MSAHVSVARRVGRRLRRVPIVGPVARSAYTAAERAIWNRVLTPLRHRRLAAANRVRDVVNAHAITARNVTKKNTRRAYNRLYASDRLLAEYLTASRVSFYELVASRAAALAPSSVLDVGCGTGHLLRALLERCGPIEVAGVDHAPAAIARARRVVGHGAFEVCDLATYSPGRTFDLVLCTEVLEHVTNPTAARSALGRLVAPGGHVVATVPDGEQDDWEGHLSFWSQREFASFLRPLGEVEVERVDGDVLLAVVRVCGRPHADGADDLL